jgi:hypothetical protein
MPRPQERRVAALSGDITQFCHAGRLASSQPQIARQRRKLGSAGDAQLVEDIAHMHLDGKRCAGTLQALKFQGMS